MEIPPESEWMTIKEVAKKYNTTAYRVRHAYREGRENKSGDVIRLQVFRTFSGIVTTQKMVEEFLMRLNG